MISGEHGIGTTKRKYFLDLEDPVKVDLMRRIKAGVRPERHPQPRDDLLVTGTRLVRAARGATDATKQYVDVSL